MAGPVGFLQLNPYTPCASRVSELEESGYVPGAVGNPSLISWLSGATAGSLPFGAEMLVEGEDEQAASEAASSSAAATRTEGSALRRRYRLASSARSSNLRRV